MKLTEETYFSLEADNEYMSNSSYQTFMSCEFSAMSKLNGTWKTDSTDAMMIGSYVDAWNEGLLDQWIAKHPEIISSSGSTKGQLKAGFKQANDLIEIIKADNKFVEALSGEKQRIFNAEWAGTKWKTKIDSYFPRTPKKQGRIVDLKVLKEVHGRTWNEQLRIMQPTIEARGYFDQVSIYCKIEALASGREPEDYYEPFLAIITKEAYPDKVIVSFNSQIETFQEFVNQRLALIESNMERILSVKSGASHPMRCEMCDCCRSTKMLANTGTTHYSQVGT
jgi:hypothetical protein